MLKPDGTHIVGIDLGTTYSLVADIEHGRPLVIPNALGELLTPSAVSIDEHGSVLVGAAAKARALRFPGQSATSFKRDMGTNRLSELGAQSLSAVDLSALVLGALKADAEAALQAPVSEAVITVPAYFGDAQRQATRDAAHVAGLKAERIINEPTAAALAYGFHQRHTNSLAVVFDLGGGTFDVSVLRITDGVIEVLASAGNTRLGGDDFTAALAQHSAQALGVSMGDPLTAAVLTEMAEAMKRRLSQQLSVDSSVRLPGDACARTCRVTRPEADRLWAPLLEQLKAPVLQALGDARVTPDAIDNVLLVGGATRQPCVQHAATRLFGKAGLHALPPDQAVAMGAAVQAALKIGDASVDDLVATDIAPFSLGIRTMTMIRRQYVDDVFTPILERGTVLPASRVKTFSTLSPGQTQIRIAVFQGEHSLVSRNTHLGAYSIEDLPQGIINDVEVRFTYDLNGILEVETTALATGKTSTLVLNQKGGALSTAELEAARSRFEKLKIHPRELLPNRTATERAESLYAQLLGEEREELALVLNAFRACLHEDDRDAVDAARRRLMEVVSRHSASTGRLGREDE